jgi:hypothetical protein
MWGNTAAIHSVLKKKNYKANFKKEEDNFGKKNEKTSCGES